MPAVVAVCPAAGPSHPPAPERIIAVDEAPPAASHFSRSTAAATATATSANSHGVIIIAMPMQTQHACRCCSSKDAPSPQVRELRGWLMVLATVVASITYASGLSPPGGFERTCNAATPTPPAPHTDDSFVEKMMPALHEASPTRYRTFYYSNTAAFALSLSIILLLASKDLRKMAKTKAFDILVALDMLALLVAYISGSTFTTMELVGCVGLVLIVPVALLLMYSGQCGKYLWDEL